MTEFRAEINAKEFELIFDGLPRNSWSRKEMRHLINAVRGDEWKKVPLDKRLIATDIAL